MKAKVKKRFHVGLYYQTPTGRAGAQNYVIDNAKSEDDALRIARKRFLKNRKGKGYKIQGGDAQQTKT
jgi:hypothetical protein